MLLAYNFEELMKQEPQERNQRGWVAAYDIYQKTVSVDPSAAPFMLLGYYYQDGIGGAPDPEKAEESLSEYIEILGTAEARFNVARLYANVLNADLQKSAKYLIEAINLGHEEAAYYGPHTHANLMQGVVEGLSQEFDTAVAQSARHNNELASQMFQALAKFYGDKSPAAPQSLSL